MSRRFDPILVEVIKNELAAVTEEMAIAVSKTARSAMVKIGDFAATICDGQGRLIGPGYAAPFQLAIFLEVMAGVIRKWHGTFRPDDVLVVNDPYAGMGHMPDVAVITPVFWHEHLIGHCQLNGSQPYMTTIYCVHDFFEYPMSYCITFS